MEFPDNSPLKEFNSNFYLESGTPSMPIYIFKFGESGALVHLFHQDRINGPHGRFYQMIFADDYNFDITGKRRILEGNTQDELFQKIAELLGDMRDGKQIF